MCQNKLNQLVSVDSTLQRLRDVAGSLMLADRQQEELVNYINGFMKNFAYYGSNRDGDSGEVFSSYSLPVCPIIKDIEVIQGTYNAGIQNLYFLPYFTIETTLSGYYYFLFTSCMFWKAEKSSSEVFSRKLDIYGGLDFVSESTNLGFVNKLTDTSPLVSDGLFFIDLAGVIDLPLDQVYTIQYYSMNFTGLKIKFAKKV